jgi:hypothetical protein
MIDMVYQKEISEAGIEEQENLILDHKTALGMFLNYPYKDMKFRQIISEEEFRVPLDKDTTYVGRVDGRVLKDKFWWIREVKTTGMNRRAFENTAQLSSQGTGYLWAMEKQTGLDLRGIMFDYLRKPKLVKRVNEDAYQFAERIYLSYCDKSKQKSYFSRYFSYRSPHELTLWEDDVHKTVKSLRRCIKTDEFYRNTNSCWMYNTECPYRKICFLEKVDKLILELFYKQREEVVPNGGKAGNTTGTRENLPWKRSQSNGEEDTDNHPGD